MPRGRKICSRPPPIARGGRPRQNDSPQNLESPVEFTLRDEARETNRRDHTFWNRDAKLRFLPVPFVSTGQIQPLRLAEEMTEDENGITECKEQRDENQGSAPNRATTMPRVGAQDTEPAPSPLNDGSCVSGDIDSDEEVLLFRGRNRMIQEEGHNSQPVARGLVREMGLIDMNDQDGGAATTRAPSDIAESSPTACQRWDSADGCGDLEACKNLASSNADRVGEAIRDYIDTTGDLHEIEKLAQTGFCRHFLDIADNQCGSESIFGAEDHADLDILDLFPPTRAALSRSARQPTRNLAIDMEDQEASALMSVAVKKDRLKRADKRREREVLRSRGMLGGTTSLDELSYKYDKGISVDQVVQEIQTFIAGNKNSLILPPMDPSRRKIIHDLAYRFKMTSKSIGRGVTRRPTIVKTGTTPTLSAGEFDHDVAFVFRRHFGSPEVRRSKWGTGFRNDRSEAITIRKVTPKEGDTVDAALPELSSANRGRVMLEKMGWSTGTALGCAHNKGILQPVVHVVKKTKSGLGSQTG